MVLVTFCQSSLYYSCRCMEDSLSVGDKKIIYINFRRHVTLCLLKVQQHREIESIVAAELPLDVRFDGVNHFLGRARTQGRRKVCKKK